MRIKIILSYNGAVYMGFQSQPTIPNTVMGTLYRALERIGITSKLHASGRTDRGVHANAQVIHCDLPSIWTDTLKLHRTLNHRLPDSIRIRKITEVSEDFHARYSASRRIYRYILSTKEPNPFEADFVTFVSPFDFKKLSVAIKHFEGEHNFEFFKKTGSDTTHSVRTIYKAYAYRYKSYTVLYFEANGYLRSQIRLMSGMLLRVANGEHTLEELDEQLQCKKRHSTALAPHNGLYLAKIIY